MTATVLRTPGHRVTARAVPDALRALWRECCSGNGDENVSRSLTMNLIAVVAAAREPEFRVLLDALAARQPCRAFLAVVHATGDGIEATVHGAARTLGSTRDLVLEQIDLRVPQAEFARLPGLIRPLLVNDIPTHCYWATEWPREPQRFDALAALADHAIVDSTRFLLPASELDAVEQRRSAGRPLTDLAWLRLRPWRRALAEVFERTPFTADAVTEVVVRHGEAGTAAAALLGRWLERRLHAHVALETDPLARDLAGVELTHGDAVATATLQTTARIEVTVATPAACFLPFAVPASRGTEGDLLAAAIDLA